MTTDFEILPVSRVPSFEEFIAAFEIVPFSFAAQLFKEVYDQIFLRSTDLRDQYNRFYSLEYKSYSQYLELAHEIRLSSSELEKSHLFKLEAMSGIIDPIYDDNIFEAVVKCIRNLEAASES